MGYSFFFNQSCMDWHALCYFRLYYCQIDWPKGFDNSKVIYEFFDYNCGFCKKVFSDLMELTSEDNEIKVVFIELPVLGQSSLLASKAAYVAHKSGKYFEMHQQLINHRGMIDLNDIKLFAKQSNINSDLLIKIIKKKELIF